MTTRPQHCVTIWNEFLHEQQDAEARRVYPDGIHTVIADGLRETLPGDNWTIQTATLHDPEHGLDEATLGNTDVLMWWGHQAHDRVSDDVVARVLRRVWQGMGLIALHSAHHSKVFTRLMGTSCNLRWREQGEVERIWFVDPYHPIVADLDCPFIELPTTEMYGELFDIPVPEELVAISWFEGGEVFRSGCTFRRGKGRIFYFRPGHETYPIYHSSVIRKLLANAVDWALPRGGEHPCEAQEIPQPLSPIAPQRQPHDPHS